jgi:hypothetical protein
VINCEGIINLRTKNIYGIDYELPTETASGRAVWVGASVHVFSLFHAFSQFGRQSQGAVDSYLDNILSELQEKDIPNAFSKFARKNRESLRL